MQLKKGKLVVVISETNNLDPALLQKINSKERPLALYSNPKRLSKYLMGDTILKEPDLHKQMLFILEGDYGHSDDLDLMFNDKPLSESPYYAQNLLGLYALIKLNKVGKDILVLNQPECGLHPSKQLLLARLIVALVNSGSKITLLTHSDIIIRELSLAIMFHECGDYGLNFDSKIVGLDSTQVQAFCVRDNHPEPIEIDLSGIYHETADIVASKQDEVLVKLYDKLQAAVDKE